jgi:hypothetical protein
VEAVSPESKVARRLVREQASLEEQLRLLRHVEAEAAAEAEAARAEAERRRIAAAHAARVADRARGRRGGIDRGEHLLSPLAMLGGGGGEAGGCSHLPAIAGASPSPTGGAQELDGSPVGFARGRRRGAAVGLLSPTSGQGSPPSGSPSGSMLTMSPTMSLLGGGGGGGGVAAVAAAVASFFG